MVGLGARNNGEDCKCNGGGFVDISQICMTQERLFDQLDGVYFPHNYGWLPY